MIDSKENGLFDFIEIVSTSAPVFSLGIGKFCGSEAGAPGGAGGGVFYFYAEGGEGGAEFVGFWPVFVCASGAALAH